MSKSENITLNGSQNEQQKGKGICTLRYISKIVNSLSILCSFVAMGLFGATFFGPTHILDYRSTKIIHEYAHHLVIASVIFFCFAILLSLFKEDSKRNPVGAQINESSMTLFENRRTANDCIENSKLTGEKLKLTKCSNEVKCDAVTESNKHTNDSSKTLQGIGTLKQAEKSARNLSRKTESLDLNEKLSQVDKQVVPYKKEPKSPLHEPNIPAVISSRVPNFWNIMSTSGNNSATEVTASRKVTVFPGGIAQSLEEYQIRQTTFFRCTEGGVSFSGTPAPKFSPDDSNQKLRMSLPMFKEPHKNQVSDVLRKFESMNIYY